MTELIVFDTETTGLDSHEDRIIQLYIGKYDHTGLLLSEWEWLVNPGVPIAEEASEVHGYTEEYLAEHGRVPAEVFAEVKQVFLDNHKLPLVAFNLNFDLTFVDAEFKRHGLSDTFGEYAKNKMRLFDPLVVDRAKDRYRKGRRTLEVMSRHYGIEFDPEQAHDAAYDVHVTAKLAFTMMKRYGWVSNVEQAMWYRTWAEGLESYFRKQGKDETVDKSWPLRERSTK